MFYLSEGTLLVEGHLIDVERGAVVRTVRVSGSPESIPAVEMALASKLGSVFSDPQEIKGVPTNERDLAVGLGGEVAQEPAAFPSYESNPDLADDISSIPGTSSMALRTDSLLRMERLRTMRDSAAKLANDIWERAVSIQVGSPEYKPISQEPLAQDQTLNVLIPVIAQLQGNWFNGVRQYVNVLEGAMNSVPNSIVVAFQSEDPGAQQVFVEAMHAPRRLFVRAIGEGGQVVAVSSQWEWRVDQRVHVRPDGTIGLSVAPAILLKLRLQSDYIIYPPRMRISLLLCTP